MSLWVRKWIKVNYFLQNKFSFTSKIWGDNVTPYGMFLDLLQRKKKVGEY
jgi:hypothetical protein